MNDLAEKNNQNVLSSPKARKFARELGVDVRDVDGSERLGRVIEKDIKEFISSKINKKENIKINKEYEHSEFGKVEIKEIPRIKRIAKDWGWSSGPTATRSLVVCASIQVVANDYPATNGRQSSQIGEADLILEGVDVFLVDPGIVLRVLGR